VHPLEVFKRIRGYGIKDEKILSAAILHDILEDTEVTADILLEEFGPKVLEIVKELTHDGSDKHEYMESFVNKSLDAIIIKIADRYSNVLDYYADKKSKRYAAKYALKAYPVIHAFLDKKQDFTVKQEIMKDLIYLDKIVQTRYTVSLLRKDDQDIIKMEIGQI